MPYRPPGGRDWNKNGTYDWSDRLKDYRAYEIVTGNKHPLDPAGKDEPWRKVDTTGSSRSRSVSSESGFGTVDYKPYYTKLMHPDYDDEVRGRRNIEYVVDSLKEFTAAFDPKYRWREAYTPEEKKNLIKNCRMEIISGFVSWEYTVAHPDKAAEICTAQQELSKKYCELLTELLQNEAGLNKTYGLDELMLQSCERCKKLCKSSEELFSNVSFYRSVWSEMTRSVKGNGLLTEPVLQDFKEMDKAYKSIGNVQILCMERIMNCLDRERFLVRDSLQKSLIELADAFNRMWTAYVRRHIGFQLCPEEDTVLIYWRCYESILKGIPQHIINGLNEFVWEQLLDAMETTFQKEKFVKEFRQNLTVMREARLKQDLADAKRRLEAEKPNVYIKITTMEQQICEKARALEADRNTGEKLECKIRQLNVDMSTNHDKMKVNQNKIWELDRKFFGKRKNQETIRTLELENAELQKRQNAAEQKLQELEQFYRTWKKNYDKEQAGFAELDRQLAGLKEKNGYPV